MARPQEVRYLVVYQLLNLFRVKSYEVIKYRELGMIWKISWLFSKYYLSTRSEGLTVENNGKTGMQLTEESLSEANLQNYRYSGLLGISRNYKICSECVTLEAGYLPEVKYVRSIEHPLASQ
jgi:hypothetical protein